MLIKLINYILILSYNVLLYYAAHIREIKCCFFKCIHENKQIQLFLFKSSNHRIQLIPVMKNDKNDGTGPNTFFNCSALHLQRHTAETCSS